MRWRRWLFVGALSLGLAAGCGNGEAGPVDNQTNDENQNDNQNQTNEGPNQTNQNTLNGDDFADDVDVWVGAHIGNEDDITELEDGQSFGGRFVNGGTHFFSLEASAGQVIDISKVAVESELEDRLDEVTVSVKEPNMGGSAMYLDRSLERQLSLDAGEGRQFFAPVSGKYRIGIEAPGGEDEAIGFAFDISVVDATPDTESLDVPGTASGTLNGGEVDVYEISVEETTSVALEVLAQQLADPSPLDAWMYVWRVGDEALVAESNEQSGELVDPRREFALEGGQEHWVVVDMVEYVDEADYDIDAEFLATTEDNPKELSLSGDQNFQSTIEERTHDYYSDYLHVTASPGESKRLTIEGDGALQPAMLVVDTSTGLPYVVLPVDGVASVVLGAGEDAAGAVTFDVEVSDVRNFEAHDDAPFGGSDFGYGATLEAAAPQVQAVSDGTQTELPLDEPGDVVEVQTTVGDGSLLWLDGGAKTVIDPGVDASKLDFVPSWGLSGGSTLAGASLFSRDHTVGYLRGNGAEESVWFRDAFFRGGVDYGSEIRVQHFDVDVSSTADLVAGNNTAPDSPAAITPPVEIAGEFSGDDSAEPETYYFSFSATAGDLVAVVTENEAGLETTVAIRDVGGQTLAEDAELMRQFQSGGQFRDRALVYEAESGGDYVLEVQQDCGGGGCDVGQARVVVVVE